MRYSVRLLRRVQADLEEIQRYIQRDRPEAAEHLLGRIMDGIESLEGLPNRGRSPRDDRLRMLGFRVLIVGDYLIFYKVLRAQVRVYPIIHGRRRYEHLI